MASRSASRRRRSSAVEGPFGRAPPPKSGQSISRSLWVRRRRGARGGMLGGIIVAARAGLFAERLDEFLEEQRIVALDRAREEILGGGRVLAVPDLQERFLRGLEEAVGVLLGPALRDRALLEGEVHRPLLFLPHREVEGAGLLHVGLVEALGQALEDLL